MGVFTENVSTNYLLRKEGNGVYVFVLSGKVEIEGYTLKTRDGFGVWDTNQISVKAHSASRVLLMEVPMVLP